MREVLLVEKARAGGSWRPLVDVRRRLRSIDRYGGGRAGKLRTTGRVDWSLPGVPSRFLVTGGKYMTLLDWILPVEM